MKIYIVGSDDGNGAKNIYAIYVDLYQAKAELKSIDNSDCYIEEYETDDDENKRLMYGFSFKVSESGDLIEESRIRSFRNINDDLDFIVKLFNSNVCYVHIYSEPHNENEALKKAVALYKSHN